MMCADSEQVRATASVLGLMQAGFCLAFAEKLSRNARIASAAISTISGLSLMHQLWAWRTHAIRDTFPPPIPLGLIQAIGGHGAWTALPEYKFGNEKQRNIDYVEGCEMSAPLMKGKDALGRSCLLLRYRPRDLKEMLKGLCCGRTGWITRRMAKGNYMVVSIFYSHSPELGGAKIWEALGNRPLQDYFPFEHKRFGYEDSEAHAELKTFVEEQGNERYMLV